MYYLQCHFYDVRYNAGSKSISALAKLQNHMEERQPNSLQTPVKQGSVVGLVMNRIKEVLINLKS